MSGFGPSGYRTFPGRATKAAAHPARSAPTISHACAATSRSRSIGSPSESADRAVRLSGWLEATHSVHRERAFEEVVQAGVCQLLLDGCWRGVRQRDEP